MIALAHGAPGARQQRSALAEREGVPSPFMDQILLRLQRAGLVRSWRGRAGGLSLLRPPAEITALDIIEASEDDPLPVLCLEHAAACQQAIWCNARDAWALVDARIRATLRGLTLKDMAEGSGRSLTRSVAGRPTASRPGVRDQDRAGVRVRDRVRGCTTKRVIQMGVDSAGVPS